MADLNTHAEALKSIFKKIFSGQYTYGDGSKSVDLLKGKEDYVEKNIDWSMYSYMLDTLYEEISGYIWSQKLNDNDIHALMDQMDLSKLEKDQRIGMELEKVFIDQGPMEHSEDEFESRMMYDPETGEGKMANTEADHLKMKDMGWTINNPEWDDLPELDDLGNWTYKDR